MKIMGFSTENFPNKPICWRVASAVVSARFILEVVLLETWIRGDGKLRAKPSGTGKIHPNFRKQWRFIAWNICIFLVCWKCLGQTARIEHGKGFSALDDILQYLVGGLEHDFYEFPYIGNNIPNWRAHIFQRGRYSTNQICSNLVLCIVSYGHNLKPRLSWRSSSWSRNIGVLLWMEEILHHQTNAWNPVNHEINHDKPPINWCRILQPSTVSTHPIPISLHDNLPGGLLGRHPYPRWYFQHCDLTGPSGPLS